MNVTDTSESTATALISPAAFTPDGGPVMVEFFAPFITTPSVSNGQVVITLFEGSTEIGRLAVITTPAASNMQLSVVGRMLFTPTAAAHRYKLCAFTNSLTGTPAIGAGVAGTAANPPAFVRFTKV